MAKSQEIATTSRASADIEKVHELVAILRGEIDVDDVQVVEEDPEVVQRRMFEQALHAKDEDELENLSGTTAWKNYLNRPMQIIGFDWAKSTKKDGGGPPVFAVVDVIDGVTGDELTVTCGSWGVWQSLIWLAENDKLPAVRILEEVDKPTKSGNKPLRLASTKSEKDARMAAKAKERL